MCLLQGSSSQTLNESSTRVIAKFRKGCDYSSRKSVEKMAEFSSLFNFSH